MLKLNETGSLTPNFESLGFSSIYFLNNLGSIAIAFIFYLVSFLFLMILDRLVWHSETAAEWQHKLKRSLFHNSLSSLLIESYIILSVCALINLEFTNWTTYGQAIQSALSILVLVVLLLFPPIVVLYAKSQWQTNIDEVQKQFEPFFEEITVKKGPKVLIYPSYFLARRFLMALLVVYLRGNLFMQLFFQAASVIAAVIIVGFIEPFSSRSRANVEFFNEAVIMLILYSFFGFTPFVADLSVRVYCGFYCQFVVSMHMIINIFLITFDTFHGIMFSVRIWYAFRTKKQAQLALQQRRSDAKLLRRTQRMTRKQQDEEFRTNADLQVNALSKHEKTRKMTRAVHKRKEPELHEILEVERCFEDVSEDNINNMPSKAEATRWNENKDTQVDGAYIRNAIRQRKLRVKTKNSIRELFDLAEDQAVEPESRPVYFENWLSVSPKANQQLRIGVNNRAREVDALNQLEHTETIKRKRYQAYLFEPVVRTKVKEKQERRKSPPIRVDARVTQGHS